MRVRATVPRVITTLRADLFERLGLPPSSVPTSGRGLSTEEREDARAFAEALFSVDGTAPDAARMDWFCDDFSDFAAHLTPKARRLLGACLAMPTWLAPPLVGKVGRLRTLPIAERIEALEKLERSPIGIALFATKAMTSLVYHEHPDAAREIGWDRACMGARR